MSQVWETPVMWWDSMCLIMFCILSSLPHTLQILLKPLVPPFIWFSLTSIMDLIPM